MARRIALFGGSFDPVHRAHRALAEAALVQLPVDELWWLPVGQPWQKARTLAPAEDRVAMVRRVIDSMAPDLRARQRIETCEIERGGPTYTIDTLQALRRREPGVQWWLILGQDQLRGLPTWHRWQEVVEGVQLAVAQRPAADPAVPAAGPSPETGGAPLAVHPLILEPHDISSTVIRARVAQGLPLDDQVTPEVGRYIADRGLYRHRA